MDNSLVDVLITARGGSKRLPGKNLKYLCGKPLIAWSIEAAKESSYVDKIYVSTDSNEISEISKKYGAIVPRLRDKILAEDKTTSFETAMDFVEYFRNDYESEMLLLQPTSPLRFSKHINEFMKNVREKKSKQMVAVRDITKFFSLVKLDLKVNQRMFIPNGSMYYTRIDVLKSEKTFFSN